MSLFIDVPKLIAGLWLVTMWTGLLPMTLTAVTVVVFLSMCTVRTEWS